MRRFVDSPQGRRPYLDGLGSSLQSQECGQRHSSCIHPTVSRSCRSDWKSRESKLPQPRLDLVSQGCCNRTRRSIDLDSIDPAGRCGSRSKSHPFEPPQVGKLIGRRIDFEPEFANLGTDDDRVVGTGFHCLIEPEHRPGSGLSPELLREMQGELLRVPITGGSSRVAAQSKDDRVGSLSRGCGGNQGDPGKDHEQGEDGVCAYQKHQMSLSRDAHRPQASLRRCPTLGQIDEAGAAFRVGNSDRRIRGHAATPAPSPI